MKKYLIPLSMLLMVACTVPNTPAQTVFLLQSDYAVGLRVELAYSNLPRCIKPKGPKLCSDVNVIRAVRKADDTAWVALKEAETAVRTPGFAESKVTASVAGAKALVNTFVQLTDTLKIK